MKYKLLLIAIVLFTTNMLFSQSVVVNKYYNSGSPAGAGDVIELLVVQDNTNLQGLVVKSFSASNANDNGGSLTFTNDALWASLRAGTLIIIRLTLNTAADISVSCTDFKLDVGGSNTTYFTINAGTFDIASNDMCMIKAAPNTGVVGNIHTLRAGSAAGAQWVAIAGGTRLGTASTAAGTNFAVVDNASSVIGDYNLGTSGVTVGTGYTLGSGNNANNTNFINFLRGPVSSAATSVSISSFSANWAAVTGAVKYRLDVATDVNFSSLVVGYNNLDVGNVVTYSVTGLSPGTAYYYRVRAENVTPTTSGNSCTQTLTTLNGKVSVASGDWNTAATWNPVGVPIATDNVVISTGHIVSTSIAITGPTARTGTTTVDGTFQLNAGGWVSGTAFTYNATTGGLNFNDTATYGVNNTDTYWPSTLPPFNVSVLQGGIQMNSMSRTVAGTFTIASGVTLTSSTLTLNGTCQINSGGFFNNAPIFGSSSLLKYNATGTYRRGFEWIFNGVGTIGVSAGYPNNVQISNSTTLDYNNGNPADKAIKGNLTIDALSVFNMTDVTMGAPSPGTLTIGGSVINNGTFTYAAVATPVVVGGDYTNSGTTTLGTISGADLKLAGNFANTGTFNGNNRAVFFSKAGTQTVSSSTALTIPYVVTTGGGTTVQLLNDLIISSPLGGNAISFGSSSDVIDINGLIATPKTLTIGSTGNAGVILGSGSFKGSIYSNLTLLGTGNIGTVKFGPLAADMNLATFVMNRTSTGGCVMGSNVTINANSATALTLTAGIIDLGAFTMTMASTVPPLTSGSSTSYVIADKTAGGVFSVGVILPLSQVYKFPIGDSAASNNGSEYSPCTINFTVGTTFTGAFITAAVDDIKEPNYDAVTDYLSRYWEIKKIGTISGGTPAYTFVGTFINSELNGQNFYKGNQWNGAVWSDTGLTIPAAATTFQITASTILTATNHITAGRRDPEMNIRHIASATNYLTGSTYNFGTVNIGSSSAAITLRIQNLGQATLNLTAFTLTGSNYTTSYVNTTVAGGGFIDTLIITFTPTVSGTITGSISIVNNDPSGSENPYVINFTGVGNCVTPTIAATPTSGPAGTEVLINASVGTFPATPAINFNGVAATYILNSPTQLLVTVPDGAVSGGINIVNTTTGCITTTAFTVISKTGTCTGMNELIMTEIYDKTAGALGYIEIYNGTGASINLSTYKIRRFADTAAMQANNYQDYAFNGVPALATIANNTVKYGKISADPDTASPDFTYTVSSGINGSDIFYLYNGTTVVDVFAVPTAGAGYTEKRNTTTTGPNTSSNPSDWTEITPEVTTDLGLFPYTPPVNNVPSITTDPVDLNTCNLTASFSVVATAPVGSLTYQWQYNSGLTANWAPISGATFAGVTATGFTSSTLNLNGAIGTLNGYQFYCQVIQSGGCIMASDAAQLTVSTATWNGTTWTNGPPSLTKQVILTGSYDMAAPLPSFEACSLYVNSPNVLTITDGNYVAVQNNITVATPSGNIIVNDNGSLVQIDDNGVNTGSVTVRRIATAKANDYVYFSSPVANFPITSISPATSTALIWKWNPTLPNSNNGEGSWVHPTFTPTPDNMAVGVGYIIKGLTGLNDVSFSDYLTTFTGTPFNGIKQPSIARGDITTVAGIYPAAPYAGTNLATISQYSDNMNLLGNPYPSALNAIKFLTLNTNIDGNIRLWTHGTAASISASPYYGSYGYNYAPGDYITYNVSGTSTGPSVFGGYVASGQGFFVTMNDGAADATQTVTFNNAMRSDYSIPLGTYSYYNNSNFYRSAASHGTVAPIDIERHRIWLDLVDNVGAATRMLVGYIAGATIEKDRLFDASTSVGNFQNLYSLIDDKPFGIQGRALPFDSNDVVPLGIKVLASGTYTIAIGVTDGLFHETNQDIYLEDKVLNIIHDLRQAPYVFTSESGKFDARFVLRYKNTTALGTVDFDTLTNSVIVATPNQNQIAIKSAIEDMKSVVVYDMLGRVVYNNSQVNSNELSILKGTISQQGLIVKITLENGLVVTKKIVL